MSREPRPIGFAASTLEACFRASIRPDPSRPSTEHCRTRFQPSSTYRLFRAPSRSPPPVAFRPRADCLGSWPSSRHHPLASTIAEDPSLRSVPSLGFRSPSTVCSACGLRGLLHPRAASRTGSRSGASSSAQRTVLVERCSPPAVALRTLSRTFRSAVHIRRPRLRGFAPRRGAFAPAR